MGKRKRGSFVRNDGEIRIAVLPELYQFKPEAGTGSFDCFKNVRVITVPNKGRDIGAFLTVINQIDLNAYDVMIKLHSKKSLGRDTDGNKWRKELIKPMLGSKAKATLMLYAFYKRKKLASQTIISTGSGISFDVKCLAFVRSKTITLESTRNFCAN